VSKGRGIGVKEKESVCVCGGGGEDRVGGWGGGRGGGTCRMDTGASHALRHLWGRAAVRHFRCSWQGRKGEGEGAEAALST
jgi:hypothetical protein